MWWIQEAAPNVAWGHFPNSVSISLWMIDRSLGSFYHNSAFYLWSTTILFRTRSLDVWLKGVFLSVKKVLKRVLVKRKLMYYFYSSPTQSTYIWFNFKDLSSGIDAIVVTVPYSSFYYILPPLQFSSWRIKHTAFINIILEYCITISFKKVSHQPQYLFWIWIHKFSSNSNICRKDGKMDSTNWKY